MPRPPASRPPLDRAAVIQAAAELVNAAGPEGLTIHALALRLGIRPPSLYNHVAGLEELWRELALLNWRQLSEQLTQAAVGRAGPEGILALAQAYRAYVKAYPGLYQAGQRPPASRDDPQLAAAAAQVVRPVLAVVESLGLSGADAIHAVRALRSAVHGFVSIEIAGGFGLPLDLDESFRRLIEVLIHGIQGTTG